MRHYVLNKHIPLYQKGSYRPMKAVNVIGNPHTAMPQESNHRKTDSQDVTHTFSFACLGKPDERMARTTWFLWHSPSNTTYKLRNSFVNTHTHTLLLPWKLNVRHRHSDIPYPHVTSIRTGYQLCKGGRGRRRRRKWVKSFRSRSSFSVTLSNSKGDHDTAVTSLVWPERTMGEFSGCSVSHTNALWQLEPERRYLQNGGRKEGN